MPEDSLGMVPQCHGQHVRSTILWWLSSFMCLQGTNTVLTTSGNRFYDQPIFVETKSCRLNGLPKLAGLAHGTGLVSVYSIWPCPPGPTQGCLEPSLVNNFLCALGSLRPPPFLQCLLPLAQ